MPCFLRCACYAVPCSAGEHLRVADLLAGVQGVLSDAAASMAAASSGTLSTSAGKAAWWQQRVKLDQRMAGLVQQLDQQWLGPWRCLLMQPVQAAVEQAATAAGQAVVSEHFDSVLGEWVDCLSSSFVEASGLESAPCAV